ncbi:IS1239 transposase [Streptococcus pneumoniae]|nr:IS1239 transposase [Streptococcus pneumoniae]
MQDNYTTKAKHLTIDSRRLIERWKKEGKSNREIASLLGKAPQTIHTEIKRGTVRQCLGKGRFKEVYSADYAQQSYENNRKRSVKKSSVTKELKEKILHYHNQKFSLDKKQASTNFKPAGQSIEQRPEAINLRLENGHYEIDTVLLTRAKNYCLLVLTDRLLVLTNRKSRHQIIRLIPNKSAEVVNQALKLILKQHKILSITADNGTAQQSYENNRKRSVKKSSLTKELKEKILHYHNQKFSPEMMVIAKGVNVGISTIYYWIHRGKLGLSKQDLLYPRKGKALKKQASTNFKPAGQSIEQRPEAINLRLENGHYEIDTVLLTRAKNYCLLVLTDRLLVLTNRKSRHQIIRLIPNKSAEVVNQALKLILKQHKILSITADNGTEFNRLSNVFSEEHIYYAHPYASWERGTNENHNRLIRRWLPKGTKKMTPKEVAFIEKWINNYPKKCLDYKSPREDFWMANLNLKFSKMEIIFIKRFQ